jgi:hypothetical protein
MNPTVYIETTIVSYLTAWPSRDIVRAAQQRTTREWWDSQRGRFEVVTSELVLLEAAAGDSSAAAERTNALRDLSVLAVIEVATSIADALVARGDLLPET